MVEQILAAAPISPDLRRFCGMSGLDAFADSSTWADDERTIRPETSGWHFIDIPRGAPNANLDQYCPPAGCDVSNDLTAGKRSRFSPTPERPLMINLELLDPAVSDWHIEKDDIGDGNWLPTHDIQRSCSDPDYSPGSFF